jgi:hypothetical protein
MSEKRGKKAGGLAPGIAGRIRDILRDDPDFLVPVKKLMKHFLKDEHLPEYPEFLAILKAEPDLVVMDLEDKAGPTSAEGLRPAGGDEDLSEIEMPASSEVEMEALGYYNGPRVRLKDRVPSPADIAAILKRHTDRMLESLGQAYCLGAENFTEEEEDGMLVLLERAKGLRDSVQKAIPVPKKRTGKSGKRAKGSKRGAP